MEIKKIIIPTKLQTDTLVAVFLLKVYGQKKYPNILNAEIQIMPILPQNEDAQSFFEKGILCLDVGNGVLDHHHKAEQITCSMLTAKKLELQNDESIKKMLMVAERCDFYAKGTLSQDPIDKAFGLTGLLLNANNQYKNDPNKVYAIFHSMLEVHHKEERKRCYEFPLMIEQKSQSGEFVGFSAPHRGRNLRIAYIVSDDTSIAGFLRAKGGGDYDMVVLYLSSGHCNILTRPITKIDLRSLVVMVRKSEAMLNNIDVAEDMDNLSLSGRLPEIPQWYYDTATNSLQNGGANPQAVIPTKIPKEKIIEIIKIGLSESLWSPQKNGYIGIFLDEPSKAILKKIAIHPDLYADHVTIVYKPDSQQFNEYEKFFGQTIELKVKGMASDDKGQALLVEGFSSENEFPHVTISCKGVKPVYSNELLKKRKIQPIEIKTLTGVIGFHAF